MAVSDIKILVVRKDLAPAKLDELPSVEDVDVTGTAVQGITTLDKDARNLLETHFKGLNTDNLIIIELNRKPKSAGASVGLMIGGVILILAAIGVFTVFIRRERGVAKGPMQPLYPPIGTPPQGGTPPLQGPGPGPGPLQGPPTGLRGPQPPPKTL